MSASDQIARFIEGTRLGAIQRSTLFWAITLGIALPVLSAVLFPTYYTRMEFWLYERQRLLEMPYVAFEVAFFLWAGRNGFDLSSEFRKLTPDIRVAGSVLILAIFVSSTLIAKDVTYAVTHSLLWLVHAVFALAVVHFFREHPTRCGDGFMSWHVVGLAVLALYTAWWFATPPPLEELPFREILLRGAVPGFIDVRHFGSWTGAIAAGLAIRILFGEADESIGPARVFYVLAAGLTVWSGTRAAVLAMVVVTLVFIIARRQFPPMSRIVWALALTLVACAFAYAFLIDHIAFWLFVPDEFSSADDFAATRSVLWGRTIELWLQSPWLGLGTGSIFWEFGPDNTPTQPHNVVLQFLISWGIVGAGAGLWIIARGIRAIHRRAMKEPAACALLGFLYGLLFQSLLEGMLHYPRFIISIIVLGAMLFHFGRHDRVDVDT